jgi:hypothetical protein
MNFVVLSRAFTGYEIGSMQTDETSRAYKGVRRKAREGDRVTLTRWANRRRTSSRTRKTKTRLLFPLREIIQVRPPARREKPIHKPRLTAKRCLERRGAGDTPGFLFSLALFASMGSK